MSTRPSNRKTFIFLIVYLTVLICDLVCSSTDEYIHLRLYSKPLIVGSLIVFLFTCSYNLAPSTFKIITVALLFSLLGDVFLLFDQISEFFFITGLVMFLFAHIMYIVVFLRYQKSKSKNRLFLIFTTGYGAGLFYVLYPGLGQMLIPVVIYMIVILLMSNTSYRRSKRKAAKSYILVFVGSLFFMLSDSLLAINMFYVQLPLSTIWIMVTYAIAQFLIVYGIINQKESLNSEKMVFKKDSIL